MPFNVSIIIFLYGCLDYNYFNVNFKGKFINATMDNPFGFEFTEILKTSVRGVGQVYLCANWISGVLILIAILISSRISGFFAYLGSWAGIVFAYAVGASYYELKMAFGVTTQS